MPMTPEQVRMGRIASMHGYRNVHEDTVPAADLFPGDNCIVLTSKGEPVMSGTINDVREDDFGGHSAIKIGDMWYYEGEYKFRNM